MPRPNRLKQIFAAGEAAINGWVHTPSSFTAEVMAHAGFDSVTIDTQHGIADFAALVPMIQAINTTETVPLARVPWNEPGIIGRMLDAGCYGLICPMVNTPEECVAFVRACRYPPLGFRSHGPTRVSLWAGNDYAANGNDLVLTFAMIETAEALANIDAIIATPGLNAIYIGPADLAQSMGYKPQLDPTEPAVVSAVETIVAAARKAGVVAGMHCGTPAYARQMIERGCQFVTLSSDAGLLAGAASGAVSATRGVAVGRGTAY